MADDLLQRILRELRERVNDSRAAYEDRERLEAALQRSNGWRMTVSGTT